MRKTLPRSEASHDALDASPAPVGWTDSEAWQWRYRIHGTILALCLGVILLAALLDTRDGQRVVLPGLNWTLPETCSLRLAFGLPCPGCGMTRGFVAMAEGDVRSAWSYNPAAVPLFTWLVLLIPYQLAQLRRLRRRRFPLSMGQWAAVPLAVLTAVMFTSWISRVFGG